VGADDPVRDGWLPPRAPGGQAPPRYEGPAPGPRWQAPAAGEAGREAPAVPAAPARPEPPRFVTGRGVRDPIATASLSVAILGLGLLVITAGLGFPVALPCSAVAWYLGSRAQARERARAAEGRPGAGRNPARAGYLLGIVGVVLGIVAALGWVVAVSLGVDPQQLQHDLQRESDAGTAQAFVHAARALWHR
jgi:hypothetical protein